MKDDEKTKVIEGLDKIKQKEEKKKTKKISLIILCIIVSLLMLLSASYLIYNILNSKNEVNNLFVIINSLFIFLTTITFGISSIIQKHRIKNIMLSITGIFMGLFIIFNLLTNLNIIKLPTREVLGNLINKNINDVLIWAEQKKIKINQNYEYSDLVKEYFIINQDIDANTLIKDVKEINLTVSSGPNYDKTIILQNLVGLNIDEALKIINDNFMNNVSINYELSDTVDKDIIISQNINGEIKRNDALELIVSLGKEEDLASVSMIDLKGKSLFEATLWLKRNGIKYEITYEFSDNISRDYCISQSEKEGTTIDPKTQTVTIIISKGKEINIPDFTSMNVSDATKWITDNKLKLKFKEAYDNEIETGAIVYSNYPINSKVEEGTIIELTISKGKLKMEKFDSMASFRAWADGLNLHYEEDSEFNENPTGTIISVTPNVGEYINLNETIKVIYSKGPSTTVPNFYGKTKSSASSLCTSSKLKCSFTYRYSSSVDSGYIMSQSMSKNSVVAENTSITLTISNGPEPIKKPDPVTPTCNSSNTYTLVIQPNWVTGGSANTTIATLKSKLSAQYPNITFNYTTKAGNNPAGYIHDDSPITSGSTIKDCNTYTIIINE